jgi:hypothetical protein
VNACHDDPPSVVSWDWPGAPICSHRVAVTKTIGTASTGPVDVLVHVDPALVERKA